MALNSSLKLGSDSTKYYRVKLTNFCGTPEYSTPATINLCGTVTVATTTSSDAAPTAGETITLTTTISAGNYTASTGFGVQWESSTDGTNYANLGTSTTSGVTDTSGNIVITNSVTV